MWKYSFDYTSVGGFHEGFYVLKNRQLSCPSSASLTNEVQNLTEMVVSDKATVQGLDAQACNGSVSHTGEQRLKNEQGEHLADDETFPPP